MYNLNQSLKSTPLARLQAIANESLAACNIPVEFSESLHALTSVELSPAPCENRCDLRGVPCFTIDCADTKDMDDAVALERVDGGYKLSVHIADVAAYVTPGSALDRLALERGTSIYLPHQTIPMLPAVLSDDLCSINPGRDRNALSLFMILDLQGKVQKYWFAKSLIHSRVKGVYSEIDQLFQGSRDASIREKYVEIEPYLLEMKTLSEKLRAQREQEGAHITDRPNVKPVVRGQGIELNFDQRGPAEIIIEEFMVLANRSVADYFKRNNLPGIYRVQTQRRRLARYEAVDFHHAELALERYCHFTSPIRRLSDLKVHQVLTAWLDGMNLDALWEVFGEPMKQAAERATRCENRSDQIYKACNNFCIAHVLSGFQNTEMEAEVVGYNFKHRPLFLLEQYPVRIVGRAGLDAWTGQHVVLTFAVTDEQKGKMEVQSFRPLQKAA